MNKKFVLAIIAVLVVGGSFFGGVKYCETKSIKIKPRGALNPNADFNRGRRAGAEFPLTGNGDSVRGEIISFDGLALVVKIRDGGSKIVTVPKSVEITKSIAGSTNDLLIGANVVIIGKPTPDGSVIAESVTLPPPSLTRPSDERRRTDLLQP